MLPLLPKNKIKIQSCQRRHAFASPCARFWVRCPAFVSHGHNVFFFLSNYFKNVILLCIIQFIFCLWMTLHRFFLYIKLPNVFFFLTTLGDLFLFLSWILFVYFFAFIFLLSQDCIKNKLQGKQEFSVYYFYVFFFLNIHDLKTR